MPSGNDDDRSVLQTHWINYIVGYGWISNLDIQGGFCTLGGRKSCLVLEADLDIGVIYFLITSSLNFIVLFFFIVAEV